MNKEQLFQLYKQLYFDEIERREKIESRLQLPFAIMVVVFGILTYMLQHVCNYDSNLASYLFWVFFGISCCFFVLSILFFARSWLGYKYRLLPTPESTEKYREECAELYRKYENCDDLVENAIYQYLFNAYVEYSSWNMANNDTKMLNLERSGKALFVSFLFCILMLGPFFLGNLDKVTNKIGSNSLINNAQQIDIKD